jgi:type IV secretory pathway VirB4 component
MMAEYIKYLYKTARKFWASVGVVTQEIQDIVGSPIVKEAIINNSDVVMLLDQSKFRERFDEIKAILGLTDVDCKKIFTINRLENKEGRSVSSVRCLSVEEVSVPSLVSKNHMNAT